MSVESKSTFINWAELEARSCATSLSAYSRDHDNIGNIHDVDVFKSRSLDFDHRKAEALCLSQRTDVLQNLRTLIARGFIEEAKQQLNSFLKQQSNLNKDPEWKLELARLFAFANDWESCVSETTQLLELNPAPLTRMTALQTRSIAFFELQSWGLCGRDLGQVQSLASLYPNAQAVYYGQILMVRLLAVTGEIARATEQLKMIWNQENQASRLDKDKLLTLLRAEADLCTYHKQSPRTALLACHWLSEWIGDDQYAAMARLELYCNGDHSANLKKRVQEDRLNFPRITSLFKEIDSGNPQSTTARLLAQRLKANYDIKENDTFANPGFCALQSQYQAMLIPEQKLIISFKPFAVYSVKKQTRPYQAICAIGAGQQLSKESLFHLLFGSQKYVAHLHDHVVHQTLFRIRSQWQVECSVIEGWITAPAILIVKVTK
jgi:hypothetical protein